MKKLYKQAKIKWLLKTHKKSVNLNIGCGTDYKKGWINVDNNTDSSMKVDLNWDLRNPLPFPDNSVDFIFNEHFIEHLTVEEGKNTVKDFMRMLKPGGVLRIATPDLEVTVDKYINVSLKNDPVLKKYDLGFIKTRAERINTVFRWWGHKWLYDWEELDRRLKEVGCKKISRCKLGKSKYPSLRSLETRDESTLIVEVVK